MRYNKQKINDARDGIIIAETKKFGLIKEYEAMQEEMLVAIAEANKDVQAAIRLLHYEEQRGTLLGAIKAWWNSLEDEPR